MKHFTIVEDMVMVKMTFVKYHIPSRPSGAGVKEAGLLHQRSLVRILGKAWMSNSPSLAPPMAALKNW